MKLGIFGVIVSALLFGAAILIRSFGPVIDHRIDDQVFLVAMAYIIGMPSMFRLMFCLMREVDQSLGSQIDKCIERQRRINKKYPSINAYLADHPWPQPK